MPVLLIIGLVIAAIAVCALLYVFAALLVPITVALLIIVMAAVATTFFIAHVTMLGSLTVFANAAELTIYTALYTVAILLLHSAYKRVWRGSASLVQRNHRDFRIRDSLAG